MKITLGNTRSVTALDSKAEQIVKLILKYSPNIVKQMQDAGTYDGMVHVAGLPRMVVLKTVKEAARMGAFKKDDGGKANWAHSNFFDEYPYSDNDAWAEFLMALVLDPANKRERELIYDRLMSFKRMGKAAAVANKAAVAFFGKLREELKKHNIRKKIRKGGFQERPMDVKPSAGKMHRMNKNNPWGANIGYSAAKKTVAALEPWAEEMGKVIKSVIPGVQLGIGGMASEDGFYVKEADMRRILSALNKAGFKSRTRSDEAIEVASRVKGCGIYITPGDEETDSVGEYCLNWFAPTMAKAKTAKTAKADVINPADNYPLTRKLLLRFKCVGLGFANSRDGKYLVVSFAPSKQSDLPLSGPEAIYTQIERALKSDGFKVKYKWYELSKGLFQINYLKQTAAMSAATAAKKSTTAAPPGSFKNLRALLKDSGCLERDITQESRGLRVTFTVGPKELGFSADPDPKSFAYQMLLAIKKDRMGVTYKGLTLKGSLVSAMFLIHSS